MCVCVCVGKFLSLKSDLVYIKILFKPTIQRNVTVFVATDVFVYADKMISSFFTMNTDMSILSY